MLDTAFDKIAPAVELTKTKAKDAFAAAADVNFAAEALDASDLATDYAAKAVKAETDATVLRNSRRPTLPD